MLIEEERKVECVETTPVKRVCDFCQKEIDCSNWFRITTGHNDWGNDSCESIVNYDACSSRCAIDFAEEYIREAGEHKFNTKHIEIEHKRSIYAW